MDAGVALAVLNRWQMHRRGPAPQSDEDTEPEAAEQDAEESDR